MAEECDCKNIVDLVKSAFPDGAFEGHHDFHKRLIEKADEEKRDKAEKAEERKQIALEIKKKVAAGVVWAIIFIALSVVAEKFWGIHLS